MGTDWDALYAMQDRALEVITALDHGFYLTGGTALSRGYYSHRHSEDLDFFVNDRDEFELWRDRCLSALEAHCASNRPGSLEILLREKRFGRAILHGEVDLKLEFINDVPFRAGKPVRHDTLGLIDSKGNILANKITTLIDRSEPKDAADIYWLCCRDNLSLDAALRDADGKAAGVFPPLVAKRLDEAARRGPPDVHWIDPPSEQEFQRGIARLVDQLVGQCPTEDGGG